MSFSDQRLFDLLIGDRRTVIKIDVEGAEGMVLEALSQILRHRKIEKVVVEIDDANLRAFGSSAKHVYDRMIDAGFSHRRNIDSAPHFNEVFFR